VTIASVKEVVNTSSFADQDSKRLSVETTEESITDTGRKPNGGELGPGTGLSTVASTKGETKKSFPSRETDAPAKRRLEPVAADAKMATRKLRVAIYDDVLDAAVSTRLVAIFPGMEKRVQIVYICVDNPSFSPFQAIITILAEKTPCRPIDT
jgi:hypothetical protein